MFAVAVKIHLYMGASTGIKVHWVEVNFGMDSV